MARFAGYPTSARIAGITQQELKNLAASVKARLVNLARTQKKDFQELLSPPPEMDLLGDGAPDIQEVDGTDLTPHDWCRMTVLDWLDHEYGFSNRERLLLS